MLTLVTQHAERIRRITLSSVTCVPLHFSRLSHKQHYFRGKKFTEYKMHILILSITFVRNISLDEEFRVVLSTMYARLHVKHPLYCHILMKRQFSRVSKNTHISYFMKTRTMGAELFHADGRTHKDTTKLIATFRNFVPKTLSS